MSRLFDVLKQKKMQNTPQSDKTNIAPVAPVKSTDPLSLNHEMESFEKLVVEGVGKLKAAVTADEAIVVERSRQAQELAGSLKAELAVLKTELKETEETTKRKDLSYKQMEETLTAKISDLQNDLAKIDETLATRDNEINEYKATIDDNVKQLAALELANTNTKDEAASHAKRADDLTASFQGMIATLQSRLKETEAIVRQKEWTANDLEQRLGLKAQELERTVKNQRELLIRRDSEISDLKSQLTRLTKGISEMSSFFRKAEALTGFEGKELGTADHNERIGQMEEKPVAALPNNATVVPLVPAEAEEMVSSETFQRIVNELARIANIIAPLASLMVNQQVKALGESVEKFPRTRLPQLLECLAKEVSDGNPKLDCRQQLAQSAQITLH
jgi:chromosome segregation ATPase